MARESKEDIAAINKGADEINAAGEADKKKREMNPRLLNEQEMLCVSLPYKHSYKEVRPVIREACIAQDAKTYKVDMEAAPKSIKQDTFQDRINYFEEKLKDGRQLIDEVVMGNADVHFETLSDNCAYMIMRNGEHYWHLNIFHNGKSPLRVVMYEDESDNPEMLKPLLEAAPSLEEIARILEECDGCEERDDSKAWALQTAEAILARWERKE
jgi:hypothetical protein